MCVCIQVTLQTLEVHVLYCKDILELFIHSVKKLINVIIMKVIITDVNKISSGEINQDIEPQLLLQTDITGELVNKIKKKK